MVTYIDLKTLNSSIDSVIQCFLNQKIIMVSSLMCHSFYRKKQFLLESKIVDIKSKKKNCNRNLTFVSKKYEIRRRDQDKKQRTKFNV